MSAGWRFSDREWLEAKACNEPVSLARPLRLATLNVLHDCTLAEVLHHGVRHDAICRELEALDADVIGLNEVTRPLLERLLREEWMRRYTVSLVPDDARYGHMATLLGDGALGNLLLSRVAPVSVEYVDQPGDGRQSHVMTLLFSESESVVPRRVALCSAHFTAFPWLMEGRRKRQLQHLTSALAAGDFDLCVVMGDFNFHREAENASIPAGWREVPAVVALGATWDFAANTMLAHYLPLRNIYNGLGLGTSFGWPSRMRLDRILLHGTAFDCQAAKARLFANEPVEERARQRSPLPQTGRELQEAHRALPWQEYLFPSDHFGICLDLPLRESI